MKSRTEAPFDLHSNTKWLHSSGQCINILYPDDHMYLI